MSWWKGKWFPSKISILPILPQSYLHSRYPTRKSEKHQWCQPLDVGQRIPLKSYSMKLSSHQCGSNIMIYNTLFTFIILQVTASFVLSFINIPSSSIEAQTSTTCLMTSHQPSLHSRYSRYSTSTSTSVVVPPPPISMPVWSLSCPVSTSPNDSYLRSRMSILTYVTPVSVSSPKLWAISLFKTSLTRCVFLGVSEKGGEYNDISAISSSVNTMPGTTNSVRRRNAMGETGAIGSVEGATGWRSVRADMENRSCGIGILQLLAPSQSKLVDTLGKKTGWDRRVNKREECASLGNKWVSITGSDDDIEFDVLPDCASYIQVKLKRVADGGDHDVAICEVVGVGIWNKELQTVVWQSDDNNQSTAAMDQTSVLYSGQLRQEGII